MIVIKKNQVDVSFIAVRYEGHAESKLNGLLNKIRIILMYFAIWSIYLRLLFNLVSINEEVFVIVEHQI